MTIIRDPASSEGLKVTDEGQAIVLAEVHTEARHHSITGEVFILSSGFITSSATADTFAAILYIKNTSTTKSINVGYFRTCNEVASKWRLTKNPTSISNSTSVTAENINFASPITLDATVEYGAANSTVTGGTVLGTWIQNGPGHSDPDFSGAMILGPNDSFCLEMAPFASAAGEVCTTIEVWQTEE